MLTRNALFRSMCFEYRVKLSLDPGERVLGNNPQRRGRRLYRASQRIIYRSDAERHFVVSFPKKHDLFCGTRDHYMHWQWPRPFQGRIPPRDHAVYERTQLAKSIGVDMDIFGCQDVEDLAGGSEQWRLGRA